MTTMMMMMMMMRMMMMMMMATQVLQGSWTHLRSNRLHSSHRWVSDTSSHCATLHHLHSIAPCHSYLLIPLPQLYPSHFGDTTNTTTLSDVWSAGCVMAELMLGQPIFPGDSGVDQLVEIIKVSLYCLIWLMTFHKIIANHQHIHSHTPNTSTHTHIHTQVLGTPSNEQIREMNPNYQDSKFPQIKAHSWAKVHPHPHLSHSNIHPFPHTSHHCLPLSHDLHKGHWKTSHLTFLFHHTGVQTTHYPGSHPSKIIAFILQLYSFYFFNHITIFRILIF